MQKFFSLLLAVFITANLAGQACVRDSSILQLPPDVLILPRFYDAVNFPDTTTPPACINEFYDLSVTLKVPETFTFQGTAWPLDSAAIDKMGAVTMMPVGLVYSCDPPNCVFKKNTLGCIRIFGTPAATNVIKTYSLGIAVKAYSPALPGFPIALNLPLSANQQFFIRLRPTGQCTIGSNDLPEKIASVKSAPNPFSTETVITVSALVAENFSFEVFDLVGQRIHQENISVNEGENQFIFERGNLPAGLYIYTIGNQIGKVTRRFVID